MNLHEIVGYPLFLIAALQFYLGVILLRQNRRKSPVHRSVAAFSLLAAAYALANACQYVLASQGKDFNLFNRLSWIGWLSIPACLQFLYYLKDERSATARRIGAVLYPFWALVLIGTVATDLVEPGDQSLIPFVARTGPLELPLRVLGGSLIVWIMVEIVRLRGALTGIRRAQLNYFFHGTLIFASGGVLVVGLFPLFGGFGVDPSFAAYFSLPWVLMTFYAITRYRLFDIRVVVSRSVSLMLLFAIVAGMQAVLVRLLSPAFGTTLAVVGSLGAVGVFLAVTSLSRRVQSRVQALIVGRKYAYQDLLREATMAVITKLELDEILAYLVTSMRRALGAGNVCLFLKDDQDRFRLRQGIGVPEAVMNERPLDALVVGFIRQAEGPVVREELERMLPENESAPLSDHLKAVGAELLIPLRYQGRLGGLITVGAKGSGEPYLQSDIDLLEALAAHAAVAFENARLYEDALRSRESLKETESRYQDLFDNTIKKYLSP